jgi:hypothetical protein
MEPLRERGARILLGLLVLTGMACPAVAQDSLAEQLDDNLIADLLTGLISFTLAEELVGATYRIDTPDPDLEDAHVTTFKLPWRTDLDVAGRTDALHVDVVAGFLEAHDRGTLPAPSGSSRFSQDWRAIGARAGTGWNFRPHGGWTIRPGVGLALTHVENEADFDALGQAELLPLLDGVIVNWEGWALGLEATLGVLNEQRFGEVRSRFSSRYSLGRTDVFSATSDFQEGSSSSQHVALRSQFDGPTGWTWNGEGVGWNLFLAYEGFSGVERDALGFDGLYEVGSGLSARPFRGLAPLELTTSWITGPGIRGWSLGLALSR